MKKPRKADPSADARTTAAPILNKGYSEAGASHTRKALVGMKPNSGSPAEDINENLLTLRQRSRMLYMGAPLATSAIRTNRTNVVGNGLQLKSTIDYVTLGMTQEQAEEWQRHTENEFKLWASSKRNCDATGINDFYGMQQLALVSWLVSGDVLGLTKFVKREPLRPYGLRLHLIEADRCRCPVTPGTFQSIASAKLDNGGFIHDGVGIVHSSGRKLRTGDNIHKQSASGKGAEIDTDSVFRHKGIPPFLWWGRRKTNRNSIIPLMKCYCNPF
jgi:capsid protein